MQKNGDGREFPFDVLAALRYLVEDQPARTRAVKREQARIFPCVFHRRGSQIRSMRYAWKKATRAAGVTEMLLHDFRRTAVRRLEQAGVSRSVAMKLTGHKSESIYRRYAISDSRSLRAGLADHDVVERNDVTEAG